MTKSSGRQRPAVLPVPPLRRMEIGSMAVFRALQLGDMLCAVPAMRALRTALPAARITLVGLPWAEQFARRFHAYIDDFVAFPGHPTFPEQPVRETLVPAFYDAMRARRFDLAIQLHGSGRISNRIVGAFGAKAAAGYVTANGEGEFAPGLSLVYPDNGSEPIRLLRLAQFLGAASSATGLEFPITEEDERELNESGLAAGLAPGRYICIHPGAGIRDKCWPPHLFAAVADRLAEEFGLALVLTGSSKEADLTAAVAQHMRTPSIDAAAPISIGAMAALMGRARLLICNDTGVSHIAAGLRLPSVVVFTTADIQRWSPLDRDLHRCIRDPEGRRVETVLEQARALLSVNAKPISQ